MTVYLTKVWGFGDPVGPLQFSLEGWRDRARGLLRPGDLVVLIGTKDAPTPEADQGRLLGLMEPSTEPVMSMDFDLPRRPQDFDASHQYRWPYGLLNLHAWRFLDRPLLEEISTRRFSMDAAQGIVPFTSEEADKVLRLQREELPLLSPSASAQARLQKFGAAKKSSPQPSTTRAGVMHMRDAPAYTYAMGITSGGDQGYKIGWAFDFKQRARQFNRAAMPELGGIRYKPFLYHLWDTARTAYRMEQAVLRRFNDRRHPNNHEILHPLTRSELESVWNDAVRTNK